MFLRSDTFVAEARPDSNECVSDCSTHPLVRGLIACTALQFAIAHGHTETAKVLLEKGAYIGRPFAYFEIGWGTSRHLRAESLLYLAIARSDLSNVQLFIDLCADTKRPDSDGYMPLHLAIERHPSIPLDKYFEVVEILIEKGADVNAKCRVNGDTPLHYALRLGGISLFRLLLEEAGDPNAKNDAGLTPLEVAKTNDVGRKFREAFDAPSKDQIVSK